jgi:polysaccharide export outer membrane protein
MRFLVFLLVILPLAGCSRTWEEQQPSAPPGGTGIMDDGTIVNGVVAVSSVAELPVRDIHGTIEPYGTQGKAAAYEFATGYRVGAGDRLTIRVAGEPDLTADYLVDGSGNISMPFIQTIPVAGMTTAQIEKLVSARLRNGYLRNPQVSAQVAVLRPFYILGEVTTSGSFSYQPGITVQNAIAIAGGYSPRADQDLVLITRKNATGTATHKVPVTTQIYPGDIIYVRERWF